MLYNYSTTNLTGLQDLILKNTDYFGNTLLISAEMERRSHKCPCCGEITDKIHDYRTQMIKDISSFGNFVIISLRKRRYVCKNCGKRFYENISFLPKYHRMTNRLSAWVINLLTDVRSFSSVAREVNLSVSTVIRIFDLVGYSKPQSLPEVLAIDEFKGNTGKEKYQAIITDPKTGVILDILPDRKQSHLIQYLKQYDKKERAKVQFFVSDMWKPYRELSEVFFKNSVYLVDKYHYVRQIIWAFERTRKRIQKKYSKEYRLLFKNSKHILTKRRSKLKEEQLMQVEALLYVSDELRTAYYLKESFYEILDCKDKETAKQMMSDWIYDAQSSDNPDYDTCSITLINWQTGILNTFDYPYTNGFTEGCNNRIKVLKRNAYGYRNFNRFRNRILHIFSYQKQKVSDIQKEVA
ncbi:MAG: ISL3 family transposase [Clostridia bacterium]|nr:ISL3 family transposase [Clostridia bacterium]